MLKQGIYEHIINQETDRNIQLAKQSGLVCVQQQIDTAESPQILANYLANAIRQKLEDTEEQQDRVNLINRIMIDAGLIDDKQIVKPSDMLAEVMSQQQAALLSESHTQTVRPISGFRVSNLFTGGNSALSLGEEIRREIASADEICFIISFLKVSGVRIILDDLKKFCARDGVRLRIITTTYCGATQAKAIEQLAALPNTEIRISYNTDIERLHAKSYIFVRNSGMNTAYIGSSNLSKSAQTEGLEWNMRVTSVENPHIIKTALATFEMYWNSPNFEDFRIGGIEKFNKEICRNTFHSEASEFVYQKYSLLPHQKQILDKLRVEREDRGNNKNLIVAATGTGKTVISAFDYQEFVRTHSRARILFTAHREEILRQSLNTYRSVLQDANFGTLWVGGSRPQDASEYEHLFVSISMFNSRFEEFFALLDSDFYDYIVIDEALELIHAPQYIWFKQEISEITSYLLANLEIKTTPISAEFIPGLELYGCYTREEVFTLVGRQTAEVKMQGAASGVFNLPEHNATLLFVTLNKSEKDFSPSTQYNDYLINEEYFHWQSQNTDSHSNNGGKRYTEQSQTNNKIILFVREEKKDGFGNTSPFHCFGLVDYVSSHDDFPMNVTWKLHKPAMAHYLKAI